MEGILAEFTQVGTAAIARSAQDKLMDIVSVNDFGAFGNGKDDDTVAINRAIVAVCSSGGGEVVFGNSYSSYKVAGTVLLPSNVAINLSGQTLLGAGLDSGAMFMTATFDNGRLISNLGSPAESSLVQYAGVYNGRIRDAAKAFHFRNFILGCSIDNIQTDNCRQFGKFERCFYSSLSNCSARGGSSPLYPTYHFAEQNNAIVLTRVTATTAFGYLLEGGTTGFTMQGCTFEGGDIGLKIKDEALGVVVEGSYFENVPGIALDLTEAGHSHMDIRGNYFRNVDVVFDDGAADLPVRPLSGEFSKSNFVSAPADAPARSLFRISGALNNILFKDAGSNAAAALIADNWITSKASNYEKVESSGGTSHLDIRARSIVRGNGIIPVARVGNIGDPFPGQVPFCVVSYSADKKATVTIDTRIVWQATGLRAAFILEITQDAGGAQRVFGDIYGSDIKQQDDTGKRVGITKNGDFLRLILSHFDNASGRGTCTGSVQILS